MEYSAEQRAIIRRMGEISARHRDAMAASQIAHQQQRAVHVAGGAIGGHWAGWRVINQ